MEIVFELVGRLLLEVLGSFVSVAVGIAVGTIALVLMVAARRAIAHTSRGRDVVDPSGQTWSVRVVYGLKSPLGTRLAGMSTEARRERRSRGVSVAAVEDSEIWHPRRVLDAFDEAAGLVAPFILLGAILIVVLVAIELLIALPIAIAFLLYSALAGRWQIEIEAPAGTKQILSVSSLSTAREIASASAEQIAAGLPPTALSR